jgi:preprotein translocase subunit SecA
MIRGEIDNTVKRYVPPESVEEQWDVPALETALAADYQLQAPVGEWLKTEHEIDEEALRGRVADVAEKAWKLREEQVGADLMRQFERSLMLQTLDHHWREHLSALDYLRQGIHLRGYAQKNPKQEYKREAFELFSDMLDRIKQDVVKVVLTVQVRTQEDVQAVKKRRRSTCNTSTPNTKKRSHPPARATATAGTSPLRPRRRSCARARRSAATTRARAAPAGSTSTATAASAKRSLALRSGERAGVRGAARSIHDARQLHTTHRGIAVAGTGHQAWRNRREDQELGARRRSRHPC